MRRPLVLLGALLAAAILAPEAVGSVRTIELRAGRDHASHTVDQPFTLAGVHWRGPGRVLFRTRSLEGRWSGWRQAAPEDEDRPDVGSRELRLRQGWRIGNPWWAGPSDRIETRTVGKVTRVRAHLVWSPELRIPHRVPASTVAPPIVPRLSWGADESIRRNQPSYADAVRFAVVHHTAGRNGYSRGEAAAIVKGIQLYHVQGNGWNDIGYNYLVDRFGTVYEGRFGGSERNVVGAHAQGFNTGSVGIAVLGTYGGATPSQAAQKAVADLIAWRLDLAHVDPTALVNFVSGGSNRFPSGVPVLLRAVSGHRDTGFTSCPGDAFYARLDALAAQAARTGLPKIYE
ncbi:MAG: peptidoglycan recognition protein, partial [Actinobacteria bacterium]|nr:peptidoglycan recognition protein [Actinomycetota bacterium]